MGTISLPIPVADFHRAGHPPAFSYGQPDVCPLCVGKCPSCGEELKRTGHVAGEPKGRYQCMNGDCAERGWFNREGERR